MIDDLLTIDMGVHAHILSRFSFRVGRKRILPVIHLVKRDLIPERIILVVRRMILLFWRSYIAKALPAFRLNLHQVSCMGRVSLHVSC